MNEHLAPWVEAVTEALEALDKRVAALEERHRPDPAAAGHCLHHYGPNGTVCRLCGEEKREP